MIEEMTDKELRELTRYHETQLLKAFAAGYAMTSRMACRYARLNEGTVEHSQRCTEMRQKGLIEPVLNEEGVVKKVVDPVTRRSAMLCRITEKGREKLK